MDTGTGTSASTASRVIPIADFQAGLGWQPAEAALARAREACCQLERGGILLFPALPYALSSADRAFLLTQQQQEGSRFHKNISYRPRTGTVRGLDAGIDPGPLRRVMRDYSAAVTDFVRRLLLPYADQLALDYASWRPIEEQGRDLPLTRRNDLLHVDAFPTRPVRGWRIMRVFTNLHPEQDRVWNIGEPFSGLAERYAQSAGLASLAQRCGGPWGRTVRSLRRGGRRLGLPLADYSPYDRCMLHFHDFLKTTPAYQEGPKTRIAFPPGASWVVFTDGVPHAALSGRFALEHTFLVPHAAMLVPEETPVRVLQRLVPEVPLT